MAPSLWYKYMYHAFGRWEWQKSGTVGDKKRFAFFKKKSKNQKKSFFMIGVMVIPLSPTVLHFIDYP